MDTCCGCGQTLTTPSKMVAVMADPAESGNFVHRPICEACFVNPSNRTQPVKAHFFPRARAESAVRAAGSSDTVGG